MLLARDILPTPARSLAAARIQLTAVTHRMLAVDALSGAEPRASEIFWTVLEALIAQG